MMGALVMIGVVVASVLVMASGGWGASALIAAIWRVDRTSPPSVSKTSDESRR